MAAKSAQVRPRRLLTVAALMGVPLLGWVSPLAWGQLSPGPLSEAHSSLDSLLECTSCHALGIGRASFRCMDCHTEIRDRVVAGTGYHARIVPQDATGATCVECHSEHYGRDFEVLKWPATREAFDHSETGYLLEGRHAALQCEGCHTPDHIAPGASTGILMDLDRSMLGLSTECLSCHADEHRGQLAPDCASCHDFESWTPAPGFQHEQTHFPLTGLHAPVGCDQCHDGGGLRPAGFSDIAFGSCEDCHADPHAGAFEAPCATCHSTAGWSRLTGQFDFDHDRTPFPLEGGHTDQSCSSCHEGTSFSEPVAHDQCLDCHTDYHQGQFASRADQGDCGGCHDVTRFETSTFTTDRHEETAYPLLGMHVEVACDKCHMPALEATDYHPPSEVCQDCHSDAHENQFADVEGGACDSCHTIDGFLPSTYTLTRHLNSPFPLTGAHLAVPCIGCHTPIRNAPESGLQFRIAETACQDCHDDPHAGSGTVAAQVVTDFRLTPACTDCHGTSAWDQIQAFDHAATSFPLLGAHRAATCESCHAADDELSTVPRFSETRQDCSDCHADVHDGQFVSESGTTDCATCHEPATWARVAFDHERDSSFPLAGAHETVACLLCHVDQTQNGETIRVFAGTPTECASCH